MHNFRLRRRAQTLAQSANVKFGAEAHGHDFVLVQVVHVQVAKLAARNHHVNAGVGQTFNLLKTLNIRLKH